MLAGSRWTGSTFAAGAYRSAVELQAGADTSADQIRLGVGTEGFTQDVCGRESPSAWWDRGGNDATPTQWQKNERLQGCSVFLVGKKVTLYVMLIIKLR